MKTICVKLSKFSSKPKLVILLLLICLFLSIFSCSIVNDLIYDYPSRTQRQYTKIIENNTMKIIKDQMGLIWFNTNNFEIQLYYLVDTTLNAKLVFWSINKNIENIDSCKIRYKLKTDTMIKNVLTQFILYDTSMFTNQGYGSLRFYFVHKSKMVHINF